MAKIGFAVGQAIPRPIGLVLFSFIGTLCYYIMSSDRKRTIKNLTFIYGHEWTNKKIRSTAKNVFKNLGKNLFDAVHLSTLSQKKFDCTITHDDLAGMESAKAAGKGIILITAHLGCFEVLPHFYGRKGFAGVAVGRAFKNAVVDDVVRKMRGGPNMAFVDRSENSRKIIRMLREEGRIMGVLVDQDTDVEGVFADFLGQPAHTPSSAVGFAMRFNIPIVVSVTARLKDGKLHIFVSPIIERTDTGDFEADLVSMIQKINGVISGHIREFPEQWVWMHGRWKTKPQK